MAQQPAHNIQPNAPVMFLGRWLLEILMDQLRHDNARSTDTLVTFQIVAITSPS